MPSITEDHPYDIFISYSSIDKGPAETICGILEQNGISCWIAPRNITPGLDFAEAIIDGIKSSKIFILVHSANSNNSKQVIREVDRAVHAGLKVINLRLQDIPLSKQLEYYLSSVHWLDAIKPPLEEHVKKLSAEVKALLSKDNSGDNVPDKLILDARLQAGGAERSIAVLPFINDSSDQENTYFINGVMEEILNNLQKIKELRVISRTSVEKFRGQSKSIPEIARELGVNYIVEGSGQKYGSAFRLRVQLIMAARETHLWGESFQQKITEVEDIFNIQTRIAESIASELKAVISPEEKKRIEKVPSINLSVYEKYLKARSNILDFKRQSLDKALEFLHSGLEQSPDWAPLYVGITEVWLCIQGYGYEPPSVAGPKILENISKAMELDNDISEIHYLNAWIAYNEWNWKKSEEEFLKALAINPNHSLARMLYSQLLIFVLQRDDEALTQAELAYRLDPLNPMMKPGYAYMLGEKGDYKSALALAEEVDATDPGNIMAHLVILMAAYRLKDYEKVLRSDRYLLPMVMPVEQNFFDNIHMIFKESGIVAAYKEILRHLEKFAENNHIQFAEMALRYIIAGQPDKAMDWIEKGYELHDPSMALIASKLWFLDSWSGNPRYLAICEKLNFPSQRKNISHAEHY
jgi:TolB-like protein